MTTEETTIEMRETARPGIAKYSATTAAEAVAPTVAMAVGVVEAQLPEIAKCRHDSVPTDRFQQRVVEPDSSAHAW